MVGISHRELSVVATTESVKMAQQRRQTNEFGLACGVVIFTICEIPARERERDGVLISMKLRGEKHEVTIKGWMKSMPVAKM